MAEKPRAGPDDPGRDAQPPRAAVGASRAPGASRATRAPRAARPPVSEALPATAEARQARDARVFTITELAQEFDITPRAIRFYEDVGLLHPAREGRNRVYSARDRTRLKLTLRGKRLGLSLSEIKQLVTMYDSRSDEGPQLAAFLEVLAEHRRQLEQQREDIEITLAEIAQHEQRCRTLLAAAKTPRRG